MQRSSPANRSGDVTYINNKTTNGDPNAFVMETPVLDPNGSVSKYDDHVRGVWYNIPVMALINESGGTMATGDAFNLLVYNS